MSHDLIPAPRSIKTARGGFTADVTTAINIRSSAPVAAEFLGDAVEELTSFSLEVVREKGRGPVLWLSKGGKPTTLLERASRELKRAGRSAEAYALVVSRGGLAAVAGGPAGLLYAAATAAGLLEKRKGRPFWPSCTIADSPDLSFRGVHLDLKHHMERLEYLEGLPARLAGFKINALVLELEDKFLYTRRPEIAAPVGLSSGDLTRLAALCRKYHIEFIPLIQGLGHASYILKHPKYAHLREKKGNFAEFCPQAKGTYDVLFDLYEEVAAATEGTKYFHIGGDEAWLVGSCPKCAGKMASAGKVGLFLTWLDRCAEKIRSLGRTPMVWDDMLIKHAGDDYSTLPEDLFYVRWNYGPTAAEQCADQLRKYSQSGLKVIVAAAIQSGPPYVPSYARAFANIDGFAKAATRSGLAGILTTAWEDSGNHTETFWPGFAATGQAGWSSSVDIDFEFLLRFTRVFHRACDGRLAAAYRTLSSAATECFGLLTPRNPYECEEVYALPPLVPAAPGRKWRERHGAEISVATQLAASLREVRRILSEEILSGARSNSYAVEVLLAAARIMLGRVMLFFVLRDTELAVEEACDASNAGKKADASRLLRSAGLAIIRALDEGEAALSSLTAVWEKTRFPQDMAIFETPDGKYVHDFGNYTHLACKTRDLSYHLFVERRIGARELAAELLKGAEEIQGVKRWPWQ